MSSRGPQQLVSAVLVGTLLLGMFGFLTPADAATVLVGGIPEGATYNRLTAIPFSIRGEFGLAEDQLIERVEIRINNLDAPGFGAAASIASVRHDGIVNVGSPAIIAPSASCRFEQTAFGYGYGYGYSGSFGYGYGAGYGFGYGYGYGKSPLRVDCQLALDVPLFGLGAVQARFSIQARIVTTGQTWESPAKQFTVYDEVPVGVLTPLVQNGAVPFTANFIVDANDADRPISQSSWTLDFGDGRATRPRRRAPSRRSCASRTSTVAWASSRASWASLPPCGSFRPTSAETRP
jgi:hypothetical protein